jgi:hypothetical protein
VYIHWDGSNFEINAESFTGNVLLVLLEDLHSDLSKAFGLPMNRWPQEWCTRLTTTLGELRRLGYIVDESLGRGAIVVMPAFLESVAAALKEKEGDPDAGFYLFSTRAIAATRPTLPELRERMLAYHRENPDADYGELVRVAGNNRREAKVMLRQLLEEGALPPKGLLAQVRPHKEVI